VAALANNLSKTLRYGIHNNDDMDEAQESLERDEKVSDICVQPMLPGKEGAVSDDHVLTNDRGSNGSIVIPGVRIKDVGTNLPVHLLGYGNIAYKICEAS
jgi:hypothetical protein